MKIVPEASLLSQAAPSQTFLLSSMELEHKRGFNVGMIRRTKEADAQSWNDKPDEKYNIMKLKKRIWKSKEKTKSYFAMKEQRSQKLRQVATQKQKAARDHKIVMYRKYRKGELPDIQIKHSELIVPLQAAAQCDPIIARELFKVTWLFYAEKLRFQIYVNFSFISRSFMPILYLRIMLEKYIFLIIDAV